MNVLNFNFMLQPNDYSCGAVVLRMCLRQLLGKKLSHRQCEELTRCKPNGVAYYRLSKVMRAEGLRVGRNIDPSAEWLQRKLDGKRLIVVSDAETYVSDHWALAVTMCKGRVILADPARGIKVCRVADVARRAREAFTVSV